MQKEVYMADDSEIKPGYTRVSRILGVRYKLIQLPPTVAAQTDFKRYIGDNVHRAIADFFNGIPSVLTDEEGGKYYSSFLLWHAARKPKIIAYEHRMYDDGLMLTGQLDALARFPESDDLILLDWKTSYNEDKCSWPLQASYYMSMVNKAGFPECRRATFVKLDKFGDMPREYVYDQSEYLIQMQSHSYWWYMHNRSWLEKCDYLTEEISE
jgi:hypothetical protein